MESGSSTLLQSPGKRIYCINFLPDLFLRRAQDLILKSKSVHCTLKTEQKVIENQRSFWSISTPQLSISLYSHLEPINVVVFHEPSV